jgi:4-hydroxy-tetrahydrodipicolinate synthase
MEFGRLITAMVTPFDEKGLIDLGKVEQLVEHLMDTGTNSIIVAGTTGESPTLSHDEKVELIKHVLHCVKGRVKVIAGTGTNNTYESVKLSQEAERIGVDGLLLVAPYYNKPSQEGLFQHFSTIAKSVHIPCILYNIPGRTSVNLETPTTLRLAEIPNIVGIKESSGNLAQISEIIANTPDTFYVFSGDDYLTLPIISIGGFGVVSVASHIIGREMSQMITSYVEGRSQEAAKWHKKLTPIFNGIPLSNPAFIKEALQMIGINAGGVRLPLVKADETIKKEVKKRLKSIEI